LSCYKGRSIDILGADIGSIKGKTVRVAPNKVRTITNSVPAEIFDRYKIVTVCADIMFINRIPFLITISRNIKFGTAEVLVNRKASTVLKSVQNACRIYGIRGLRVSFLLMDGEFEHMRADLASLGIALNATSNDEHVGEIERYIRTVKERCRSMFSVLPFAQVPPHMVIEMVYSSVFWLNSFPPRDGVSESMSPREIVTGQKVDYSKHCKLEFGTYVQTHEEHDNTMLSRTTGAVALRPTGNVQGGYYFMSLTTGRRIS
jgi:hypothetical protein